MVTDSAQEWRNSESADAIEQSQLLRRLNSELEIRQLNPATAKAAGPSV
jgi:hypothetical protein